MMKKLAVAAAFAIATLPLGAGAEAAGQGARAQSARAQAAKLQMLKMKQAQAAQARQAGMAAAVVTAATLAATEAGECSPYLAKWMMTRSPLWKLKYDACMED